MANKKISELTSRTPALSDLILVGDPSSGYSYKCTVTALATIIETDIADTYVTLGTTQTISGAKTFSNNLTLTSVANATITQTKFLTLNASNVVNYRTGAEVLADIGGASSSSVSGTTNYLAKFTSSSAIGNSVIFESSGTIGINTTTPAGTIDISGVGGIALNGRRVINNSAADLFIGGLTGLPGAGTNTITFYTNNTSRATFDVSGNFGLGTSAPANILDIYNTNGFQNRIRITGTTNTSQLQFSNTGGDFYLGIDNSTASGFGVGGYSRVLYSSNAYPMVFFTNASERMRLDASGNLLVGTTTLATGFSTFAQIEASGTTGGIIINSATNNIGRLIFTNNNASGNEGLIRYDGSNQSMQFWTNATERMRLDASGNLGLGVTPSAWTVFNPVLQVKTGSLASSGTANFRMFANTFYDGAYKYIGTGSATQYEQDGYHAWSTAPSGTAGTAITFTERMRLDNSGNLGLGVTPSAWGSGWTALQIKSGGGSIWSDGGQRTFYSTNAFYNGTNRIYVTTGTATEYAQTGGQHIWQTAASGTAGTTISFTQAMTLFSTGNLAVGGTSDGGYRLDVTGTFRNTLNTNTDAFQYISRFGALNGTGQLKVIDIAYTGSSNLITFNTNAVGTDPNIAFRIGSANPTMYITSSSVGIGTTSPSSILDIREGNRTNATNITNFGVYTTTAQSTDIGGTIGLGGLYNATDFAPFGSIRGGKENSTLGNYAGYLAFQTISNASALTERLRITSAGNVGISTSAPASLLSIGGTGYSGRVLSAQANTNAYAVTFQQDNATGSGLQIFTTLSSWGGIPLTIGSATADLLRLTANGNLGVGTGTPTSYTGFTTLALNNATFGGALDFMSNGTVVGQIANNASNFFIESRSTFPIVFSAGGSERARITSGGAVGINTSSPTQSLEVNGNVLVSQGAGNYPRFISTVGAKSWEIGYRSGTTNYEIREDGTTRMVIANGGNVGLGISTPLAVTNYIGQSISGTNGSFVSLYTGATQMGRIEVNSSTDFTIKSIANVPVIFGTNNVERMRIKSTGQVRFVPLAADPAGAESGDVYYNSTTNKLKVYNGTAWTDLH